MNLKFWKRGPKIPRKKIFPVWLKIALWVLFVLFVLTGIVCFVLQKTGYVGVLKTAWQLRQQQKLAEEDKEILARLGKILLLPEGVPTMAIITNVDILKEQQPSFFANAKNNDHLIVYPDRAILYDDNANKIIQIGPVQFAPITQNLTFALYNGTTDANVFANYDKKLIAAAKNAQIKVKQAAAKTDYTNSLIIDVTGKNKDAINSLVNSLGASVSSLPTGENMPQGVDILIIVGKNG